MVFFSALICLVALALAVSYFIVAVSYNVQLRPKALIVIHGGAGNIADSQIPPTLSGIKLAATIGYKILLQGGSAVDAVEAAIKVLEEDEHFNAGRGSALTNKGTIEMDASIMDGSNLDTGSVSLVKNVLHPISLARMIMDKCPHAYMAGSGLVGYACSECTEFTDPADLISENAVKYLLENKCKSGFPMKHKYEDVKAVDRPGTVGAVALDSKGHVAAATSAGGIFGKLPGRIGDSAIIGAGTYADDQMGAVSATGHGEAIIKICLAHTILVYTFNKNLPVDPQNITMKAVETMTKKLGTTGGAITIRPDGQVGIYNNTEKMPWASYVNNKLQYGTTYSEIKIDRD